jgi:autotransporter-associated beta strand protein
LVKGLSSSLVALAAALTVGESTPARAATYYWDTTTTGLWGNGANWSDNAITGGTTGVVPLTTDLAVFNQSGVTGTEFVQLDAATGIAGITFINTGATTIQSSNATTQTLTIGTSGLTINAGAGAVTIGDATNHANLTLGGAQSWLNNSANPLSILDAVSNGTFLLTVGGTGATSISGVVGNGSGGITLANTATLTLSGTNTYTGNTTIAAGTQLNFNNTKAIGTGTLIISGGILDNTSGAAIVNANNNVQQWNGDFTFVGGTGTTHDLNLGTGAITLSAARQITVTAGNLIAGGAIGGNTFGVTKTGAGTLTLNGVIGTTTGGLAVNGGTLVVGNAANTFTGNVTIDGATSVLQMTSGSNGNATSAPLGIFTGGTAFKTVTLSNGGTFRPMATYNVNVPTSLLPGNGYVFSIGAGGGVFDTPSGVTLTVDDGTVAGTGTTAAELQGTGALTKTGIGTLVLRNQNVFAGTITIAAGLLQMSGTTAFGVNTAGTTIQSGAAFDVNGQAVADTEPLNIAGTGLAATPKGVITNGSGTAASFAGPITLGGASTIGSAAAGGLTLSGGISGAFALTFSNTAAGGTTISTGAVNNGGTITNSGAGAGTTTIGSVIGSSVTGITQNSTTSALTINGATANTFIGPVSIKAGTLNIGGVASALGNSANVVTIGDTAVSTAPATLNAINTFTYAQPITVASASSGTMTLSTSAGTGTFSGVVTLNKDLTVAVLTSANGTVLTNSVTGTGSLSLVSNVSTGTAGGIITLSGAVNPIGSITHSGAGTGTATIGGNIGGNVTDVTQNSAASLLVLSGTNIYTGQTTITSGTLEFLNTASMPGYPAPAAGKINVASGGTLALGYAGAGQFTATDVTNILNGTFPATFASTGTSLGLDTASGSASYTPVIGNISGSTSSGFAKLGANTLTIGTANTYTGPTAILNGNLPVTKLNSVVGGSASSDLGAPTTVANGTISLGAGATTGQLTYIGTGETTDRVINLAGASGGGTIDQSGTGLLKFTSPLTFTGGVANAKTLTLQGSTAGNGEISGQIAASALTLTKAGSNTWTLSSTGNSVLQLNVNGGIVDLGAGTLTVNNTGSAAVQSTTGGTINATGGGTLTIGSLSATNGGDNGTANGTTLTINAKIVGANPFESFFVANGTGVMVLTADNTYTGNTLINSGVISVAKIGIQGSTTSNLGSGTTISIANALSTLRYTGTGETSDRIINLAGTTTGAILEQSGTGLLKFTTNFATPGAGAKVLTLQGSTLGAGEISGAIVNNSSVNTTGVTKAGTGTWTLSGTNTFTGPTTVSGGTLVLSSTGVLDNTAITINSGGTFAPVAGRTAGNTATTASGATLTLNSGGILNLADGTIGNFTLSQGATFAGTVASLAGGALNFDLGGATTTADKLVIGSAGAGIAAVSNTNLINIAVPGGTTSLTTGNYTLIQAGSGLVNSNFLIGTPNVVVNGVLYNLSLTGTAGTEVLVVGTGGAAVATPLAFWTGSQSSSWATITAGATNFAVAAIGSPNTFALPGAPTNVTFTANSAANLSTTLDQNFTINSLAFSGTGTSNTAGSTIASGTGTNTLTINAGAVNGNTAGNGITVAAGSGADLISANVALGASQTWTNNATNPLTVSGVVSGTGFGLTTAGAGTLVLSNAANTYDGATTINAGVLSASTLANGGSPSSIGQSSNAAANLVFGTSTLQYTGGTQVSDRNFTINAGGTATIDVTQAGTNLSLAGATGTVSTGALTKIGLGALTLTGANTYTGNTTVANGVLNITGSLTGNGTTTTGSTLTVGNTAGQNGVVNISGTGSVNTYYTFTLGTNATSAGVINQTGGLFSDTTTATGNTVNFVGQAGYGYLNITGGTFSAKGRFAVSNGATSTGVVYVGGTGTLDTSAGEWLLMSYTPTSGQNGGLSQVTVGPGGSLLHAGAISSFGINMDRSNGYAVVNLAGGLLTTSTKNITFGNGTSAGITNTTGMLNVAAGTLTFGLAFLNGSTGTGSTGNNAYINFAGGTLQPNATVSATGIIPATASNQTFTTTIFGPINNSAVPGAPANFAGGVTIDTNTFNIGFSNVLRGATGSGVTQADLLVSGGSGYVGAPMVQFSSTGLMANGTPAAGYALISGGVVTGIVITDPGTYTPGTVPTVTLTGGGATTPATVTASALNTANTSGGLTKINTGTLNLTGLNTYAGATTINGGTIDVQTGGILANGGLASAIGASSNAAANLVLNGGILRFSGTAATSTDRNYTLGANGGGFDASGTTNGAMTISGDMTATESTGTQALILTGTGTGSATGTLSGAINNGTGSNVTSVIKGGTGTWNLNSTASNFSGGVSISAGTLSVTSIGASGANGPLGTNATITMGATTTTGTLRYAGSGETTDRGINLAGTIGGAILDQSGTGLLKFTGNVAATGVGSKTLTLQGSTTGTGELSGTIVDNLTGVNVTSVTKAGTGTWALTGNNSYTGTTTLSAGTLNFGTNGIGTVGPVAMNGGTLQWATGNSQDISSMVDTTVRSVTFGATAIFDTNGNDVTLANAIGGTAAFGLTKNGPGTLYLKGTNTFGTSNVIQINAGVVKIDNEAGLGTNTNDVTFGTGGGTLQVTTGFTANAGKIFNFTAAGGGTIQVDSGTLAITSALTGTLGTGGLIKTGAGTLALTVASTAYDAGGVGVSGAGGVGFRVDGGTLLLQGTSNSVVGDITPTSMTMQLNGGNLAIQTDTASIARANLYVSSPGTITADRATTGVGITQAIGTGTGAQLTMGTGSSTLNVTSGSNVTSGTETVSFGATTFLVSPTFNVTNPALATTQLNLGAITGAGFNLTKDGDGNLALTGTNTYVDTIITGGQLRVGAGSTTGALGSGNVIDNATLVFDRSNAMAVANLISGSGAVVQNGTGTTTVSNLNTYTGTTSINQGILSVNSIGNVGVASSALGAPTTAAAGTIKLGATTLTGTLQFIGTGAVSTNRVIDLAGATGGGTLDASNTNGSGAVTFTSDITASGVGTKTLTLTGTNTDANTISGAIVDNLTGTNLTKVTKSGAGTWVLTGNNPFSGALLVSAGTLQLQANAGNTTAGVTSVAGAALSGRLGFATGATLQLRSDSAVTFAGTDGITGLNGVNVTIDVNQRTATGSNNVLTLSPGISPVANTVTINATGGNGYSLALGTLQSITGTATAVTLNPTTANLSLVGYSNQNNTTNSSTLTLGGTSLGNTVTGVIANQGVGSTGTTGTVSVTKSGTSTWTLTGTSTYTGPTTINGGTLALGNGGNLGATAITVLNGSTFAATPGVLGATNSIGAAAFTLNTGSAFTMLDGTTSILNIAGTGVFTGGLNSTMAFDIGGTTTATDKLAISGAISGTGGEKITINFFGSTGLTPGDYTIISAASGLNLANLSLANTTVDFGSTTYSLTLTNNTGTSVLTVGAGQLGVAYWTGLNGTVWSTPSSGSTNWASESTGLTDAGGIPTLVSDVFFTATNATPGNLATTLGADFTINSLNYTSGSASSSIGAGGPFALTITGGGIGNPGITDASANNQTITAPIVLGGNQVWANNGAALLSVNGTVNLGSNTLTVGAGNITIGGIISGTGGVTKSGTGTLTAGGANDYTGATIIDLGTLSASVDQTLTGSLIFGAAQGSTNTGTLDLSNASATFSSLVVQTNNSATHTITVGSGKTLTLNGSGGLTVGYNLGSGVNAGLTAANKLTISGAGSLVVANTAALVNIGVAQSTQLNSATSSTLDLSGLSSVTFGNSTTPISALQVSFGQTAAGTLLLSNTANLITATTVSIGHSNGANGGPGILTLGTGTNVFRADTFNIGLSKANGTVSFASNTGPGTVVISNKAGSGGGTIIVGSQNGTNTGAVSTGTLDLRGHNSTVTAGTVTVGNNNNSGGSGSASGVLNFDTGTFNAATLNLGLKSSSGTGSNTAMLTIDGGAFSVSGTTALAAHTGTGSGNVTSTLAVTNGTFTTGTLTGASKNSSTTGIATGNINVSGTGVLTVNTGFTLATQATAGTAVGTLSITGGTVNSNASILDGGGTTTTTITLNGGTLDLKGNSIGSATTLIDALNFQSGTLQNVAEINNGAALSKTTAGTLILDGTNSYTGPTNVTAGTLLINGLQGSATGAVTVSSGATLGGNGNIGGAVTVQSGGNLKPGTSAGLLTLNNNLTLGGNATNSTFEIQGAARGTAGGYDAVNLGATSLLTYDGVLTLDISANLVGGTYDLFAFTAAPAGSFDQVTLIGGGGYTGNLTNSSGVWTGDSQGVSFTFTQATGDLLVVPEPGVLVSLLGGLGVLLGFRRSRRA